MGSHRPASDPQATARVGDNVLRYLSPRSSRLAFDSLAADFLVATNVLYQSYRVRQRARSKAKAHPVLLDDLAHILRRARDDLTAQQAHRDSRHLTSSVALPLAAQNLSGFGIHTARSRNSSGYRAENAFI
jgi:hypothetical protein